MFRKRVAATFPLLFSLLCVLGVTSCQAPTQKQRQTLRLNLEEDPQTLDPRTVRKLGSLNLVRMLFEGLVRIDKEDNVELALAEAVDISADGKTYTFHLRPARWTNGDLITAGDFAYAWKKVLDPHYPSDMAFQLYGIKNGKRAKQGEVVLDEVGIRIIDERTLQVELDSPMPYFLTLTAFPTFFPVNARVDKENPHWAERVETYISNGPFSLKTWKHQDAILVKKSPTYWDAGHVHIEQMQFAMVQEETAYAMFEKQELDWVGSPFSTLSLDVLAKLKQEQSLHSKEALATYFLRCNTGRFPFNHRNFRHAFARAIDRQALVTHVTQGNQTPATGLVPLAMGLSETPYFEDKDLEGSRQLFAQALAETGLTRETFPHVTLIYRAAERNHLIAQALQQQWFEAFGVRVGLEAIEGKVHIARVSQQEYDLSTGDWIADFNDPINFLEVFKYKNSGSNNTLWENPEYARLLEESIRTVDAEQRLQLLKKSEKILMGEMPIIPLYYSTWLYVNRPQIKDVAFSSLGEIDFKWAYCDEIIGEMR